MIDLSEQGEKRLERTVQNTRKVLFTLIAALRLARANLEEAREQIKQLLGANSRQSGDGSCLWWTDAAEGRKAEAEARAFLSRTAPRGGETR